MKTVVIGAGVVGVTTAYYLAKQGHEVTVLEQLSEVGQDASGGNAGLIAPGHSFAWASPAAPVMLMKSLRGEATAIRLKPRLDPRLAVWGIQFLRECTASRAEVNTLIKLRLCQYSQQVMTALAEEESIDYQHVSGGVFYLHRTEKDLEVGIAKMQLLRDHGQDMEVIDADRVAEIDPAFASARNVIAGAIHSKTDASGNSELFTKILAERCRALGVDFRLSTTVRRLVSKHGRVSSVETDQGTFFADNVVIATGIASPFLAKQVRQSLPVYPAKGYSLTVDITNPAKAPTIGGVDEKTLVAWARMGDQLRISSTAEFSGYDRSWKPSDFSNIFKTAQELWPEAANWDQSRMRACLRPMTPDGPPIIGRGRLANLYYNTGHGHMGWTMACGSSRILADLMEGRTPSIPLDGLQVRAFRR
jgi:D-amino-acid dehydrogenase